MQIIYLFTCYTFQFIVFTWIYRGARQTIIFDSELLKKAVFDPVANENHSIFALGLVSFKTGFSRHHSRYEVRRKGGFGVTLRRNPPEVRVTSGQKSSTKIIYIVLQTSVRLF